MKDDGRPVTAQSLRTPSRRPASTLSRRPQSGTPSAMLAEVTRPQTVQSKDERVGAYGSIQRVAQGHAASPTLRPQSALLPQGSPMKQWRRKQTDDARALDRAVQSGMSVLSCVQQLDLDFCGFENAARSVVRSAARRPETAPSKPKLHGPCADLAKPRPGEALDPLGPRPPSAMRHESPPRRSDGARVSFQAPSPSVAPKAPEEAVFLRRAAAAETKLAHRLELLMVSQQRQSAAEEKRLHGPALEALMKRQEQWSTAIAAVLPGVIYGNAVKEHRATRVINTIFLLYVVRHIKRRREFRRREKQQREKAVAMPQPTAASLLAAMPELGGFFDPESPHAETAVWALSQRMGPRIAAPGEYCCFNQRALTSERAAAKAPAPAPTAAVSPDRSPAVSGRRPTVQDPSIQGSPGLSLRKRRSTVKGPEASPAPHVPAPLTTVPSVISSATGVVATPWEKTPLLLVTKGRVTVHYRAYKGPDGKQRHAVEEEIAEGGVVGLEALLGVDARPFLAVARSDVEAWEFSVADLDAVLAEYARAEQEEADATAAAATEEHGGTNGSLTSTLRPAPRTAAVGARDYGGLCEAVVALCESRRKHALRLQPLSEATVRGSSPFFADWTAAGLAAIIATMRPLTVPKGTRLPLRRDEAEQLLTAADERGVLGAAPDLAPVSRGQRPELVLYWVVHGAVGVWRKAAKPEAPQPGGSRRDLTLSETVRPGQCAGAVQSFLGADLGPKKAGVSAASGGDAVLKSTMACDLWVLRQVDLLEALAHESVVALLPALPLLL